MGELMNRAGRKHSIAGIFTLQSINYGNRLQNYATQSVLMSYFESIETIRVDSPTIIKKQFEKKHPKFRAFSILYVCYRSVVYILKQIHNEKRRNFKLFDSLIHFSSTKRYISIYGCSEKIGDYYDAVIAGSDQIWNVNWKDLCSINSFLPFENKNKIALSASFGVDSIVNNPKIAECIYNFKALSVREEEGAAIIKQMCGRDSEVLIDPTLMLDSYDWEKVEKCPKHYPKGPYILLYFLSPPSIQVTKLLESQFEEYTVIRMNDENDLIAKNAGPSEFLYFFHRASLILTDSYHACIFSFLYNKPFLVFDRNWNGARMNSRLTTFFSKFDLQRKYFSSGIINDIWEHDYSKSYQKLVIEREKVHRFLKLAIRNL